MLVGICFKFVFGCLKAKKAIPFKKWMVFWYYIGIQNVKYWLFSRYPKML